MQRSDRERVRPKSDQGRQTRAAIVAAALDSFKQRGYLGTRVADIVLEAGVSHGSFYTYFTDKEDVFRILVAEVVEDIFSGLQRADHAVDPVERIHAANVAFLTAYERNAGMVGVLAQVSTLTPEFRRVRRQIRTAFVDRVEAGIRRAQQLGIASVDLDPYHAAQALGSMVDSSAYVWFNLDESIDWDEMVYTLTVVWARAIGLDTAAYEAARGPARSAS